MPISPTSAGAEHCPISVVTGVCATLLRVLGSIAVDVYGWHTGASGFVASELIRQLLERGHNVRGKSRGVRDALGKLANRRIMAW